jgi:hypothetical protein
MRTKAFLEKAHRQNVSSIREQLGEDYIVYDAINAAKIKASTVRNLTAGGAFRAPAIPGFVELGDTRILSTRLTLDLSSKKVISTSFNYEWKCLNCGPHGGSEAFKVRGVADSSGHRQAVILADQSFPAVLPAGGEKLCMKVILVENGSITELVEEFFRLLGNRRVPKGSVILIFSASCLGDVGVAAYAEMLVEAISQIKTKLGKETLVAPLPPLLLGGCTDAGTVRSIFELITWSDSYFSGTEGYLEESTISSLGTIKYLGSGSSRDWEGRRVTLPCKEKWGQRQ